MGLFLKYKYLFENKQKVIRVAIISMLILAALFLFIFRTGNQDETDIVKQSETEKQSSVQTDTSVETIIVDVSGEVVNPAVIELPPDSRINDAILAAGGLTQNADITQINRAAMLADGEKIFIPTLQKINSTTDSTPGPGNDPTASVSSGSAGNTKININNASATQLQEVPGIGPATANKIIVFRSAYGLFRKLEDLKKVSGIGDKTFEKMKPYICI